MAEIDSLKIKVSAEDNSADKKITAIAKALGKLDKAVASGGMKTVVKSMEALSNSASGLSTVEKAMKSVSETVGSLGKAASVMKDVGALLQQLGNVGKIELSKNLPKQLKDIGKAMRSISPDSLARLDVMTQYLSRLKGVSLRGVRDISKSLSETGQPNSGALPENPQILPDIPQTVKGKSNFSQLFSSIPEGAKKAIGYIDKLFTSLSNLAGKALPKVGTELKKVGKYLISSVTNPFKSAISAVGRWKSAIGRIAFYRMIRSAIRMITEGFSTGIKNLYEYSRLVGTEFAPTMNSLSSSALYLKNSLGAIAAPLIQVVAPAVETVTDAFVDLLNIIGKVFAALSGRSTYTQAKKYATEYGDALNGAAGAAKALKDYTLGFDELNVFNDNGSGGGGGAAVGKDYGSMFEEVEVPAPYAGWADSIRDAIRNGNWIRAGRELALKLNALFNEVNWSKWGQKLGKLLQNGLEGAVYFVRTFDWSGLGSGIAQFLNHAISGVNPLYIGELLGAKLRIGFTAAFGFVSSFNWSSFGTWLGGIVNGWFQGIDWKIVGKTISTAISGLLKTLVAFLRETDWEEVGKSIGQLLSGIDWGNVLKDALSAIVSALGGLFKSLGGFFGELDGFSSIIGGIGAGFASWSVLKKVVPLLKNAGSEIKNIAKNHKQLAGVVLSIAGISIESSGTFDIGRSGLNLGNALKTAVGSALGVAGSVLTFGSNPVGWTIGIGVSLIAGISGYVSGMKQAVKDMQKQAFSDALSASGGLSIDELIGGAVSQIDGILASYNIAEVTKYGESMKASDERIKSAQTSLNTYFTTWQVSGDQTIDRLRTMIDLMDDLASATEEKLSVAAMTLETTFAGALQTASGDAKSTYDTLLKMAYLLESNMNTQVADWKMELAETRTEIEKLDAASPTYAQDYDALIEKQTQLMMKISGVGEAANSAIGSASSGLEALNAKYQGLDFGNPQLAIDAISELDQATSKAYEAVESAYAAQVDSVNTLFSYIDVNSEEFKQLANFALTIDPTVDVTSLESVKGVMLDSLKGLYDEELAQIDAVYSETIGLITSSVEKAVIEAAKQTPEGELVSRDLDWWANYLFGMDDYDSLSPELKAEIQKEISSTWQEALNGAVETLSEDKAFGALFEAIEKSLTGAENTRALTTGISGGIINGITDGIKDPTALALLTNGFSAIAETIGKKAETVGEGIPSGLVSGINNENEEVTGATSGLAVLGIDAAKETLDAHSPSRVFEEIGENVSIGLANGVTGKFSTVVTAMRNKLTDLIDTAKTYFSSSEWARMARQASEALKNNLVLPTLKPIELTVAFTTDVSAEKRSVYEALGLRGWPKLQWKAYENGGFPERGEIFIARERSAEMIGSIGNRTAVANNDQIVEGISSGVSEANRGTIDALYEICSRLIGAIEENRTDVRIGDEEIYKANRRYEQRAGTNTTRGAFAYVR